MSSSKGYLLYILEQLSELDGISYRAMMGEYILYYRGRIFGGIYDDRLLIKPVPSAVSLMPHAELQLPYERGSKMLFADEVDDKQLLTELVLAMYDELPEPKKPL